MNIWELLISIRLINSDRPAVYKQTFSISLFEEELIKNKPSGHQPAIIENFLRKKIEGYRNIDEIISIEVNESPFLDWEFLIKVELRIKGSKPEPKTFKGFKKIRRPSFGSVVEFNQNIKDKPFKTLEEFAEAFREFLKNDERLESFSIYMAQELPWGFFVSGHATFKECYGFDK